MDLGGADADHQRIVVLPARTAGLGAVESNSPALGLYPARADFGGLGGEASSCVLAQIHNGRDFPRRTGDRGAVHAGAGTGDARRGFRGAMRHGIRP